MFEKEKALVISHF